MRDFFGSEDNYGSRSLWPEEVDGSFRETVTLVNKELEILRHHGRWCL